jgi:CheY-like chemotaxis protein
LTYVGGQVTFALSPLIRGISLARKILLADDSVTAQNMGRKILADAGYEVIAVNNGSAALKKIAELKPDLVILDVYMPGYSGLEVCQRLKESQETARIPVLLSVGKLEPFKPEEAQRVRADGYIVKPFEASELLSALSKLEDKVVPRAEPSKPGRFARAMAAAEESGRGSGSEPSSKENGWKSRISFPHQKTEVDRQAAEKEEKWQRPAQAAEASVGVAALAPAGLPKEVTPEEVAAIAAAAAQIQMAGAAIKDEHQVSEATSEANLKPAPDRVEDNLSSPPEAMAESNEESKTSGTGELAAAEKEHRRNGDEKLEETQDVPVTMAATAESVVGASADASRWTAVPVALESEEAAISLDQEMRKAYAAFAEAEPDSAGVATVAETEATPAENSSAVAEAAVEVQGAATDTEPEPEPVPEPGPVVSTEAKEADPVSVAQSEQGVGAAYFVAAEPVNLSEPASVNQPEDAAPTADDAQAEARADTSGMSEFAEPKQEPVAEFAIPSAEIEVAEPSAVGAQELQTAPETEPAMAETATVSSGAFAPIENEPEPKESETVKTTAAAWASWRQIRDTGKSSEAVQTQPKEFEAPESAPVETARAVAAGAEQIVQEASAAAPNGNPADVASIVDSVLADLRPKLMEEISRKMAEKK